MLSPERRKSLAEKAREMQLNVGVVANYLSSRGISWEMANEFQLGYCTPEIDLAFAGRLSIPYITPTGVVDIKYRDVFSGGAKYLHESGCGPNLYNAQSVLRTSERAFICEGEVDAIVAQSVTDYPAVGYPGVDTWAREKHWPYVFAGISEVVVFADGDDAGRRSADRVAGSIPQSRVVDLGDGEDVNTFVTKFGADELLRRVS